MPAEKSSYNLRDKAASSSAPYSADKAKSTPAKHHAPISPTKLSSGSSAPVSPVKSTNKAATPAKDANKPTSPTLHQRPASPTKALRDQINREVTKHGPVIQTKVLAKHVVPNVTHSTVVAGSPIRTSAPGSPTKSTVSDKSHKGAADTPASPKKLAHSHETPALGSPSKAVAHGATNAASPIKYSPGSHAGTTTAAKPASSPTTATKIPVQQTASVGKTQTPAKVSADQIKKGLNHAGAIPATPKSQSK